jgi:hypothetical protein
METAVRTAGAIRMRRIHLTIALLIAIMLLSLARGRIVGYLIPAEVDLDLSSGASTETTAPKQLGQPDDESANRSLPTRSGDDSALET